MMTLKIISEDIPKQVLSLAQQILSSLVLQIFAMLQKADQLRIIQSNNFVNRRLYEHIFNYNNKDKGQIHKFVNSYFETSIEFETQKIKVLLILLMTNSARKFNLK